MVKKITQTFIISSYIPTYDIYYSGYSAPGALGTTSGAYPPPPPGYGAPTGDYSAPMGGYGAPRPTGNEGISQPFAGFAPPPAPPPYTVEDTGARREADNKFT